MVQKLPFRKTIVYKGQKLTVYSIGWLALLIGRHIQTVREMEYNGILPTPAFETDETKVRYYTGGELVGYTKLITSFPRRKGKPGKGKPTDWRLLRDKLHLFKREYLSKLSIGGSLLPSLPNEEALSKALLSPRDRDFKLTAQKLVGTA
jgi:hypothetical protein